MSKRKFIEKIFTKCEHTVGRMIFVSQFAFRTNTTVLARQRPRLRAGIAPISVAMVLQVLDNLDPGGLDMARKFLCVEKLAGAHTRGTVAQGRGIKGSTLQEKWMKNPPNTHSKIKYK